MLIVRDNVKNVGVIILNYANGNNVKTGSPTVLRLQISVFFNGSHLSDCEKYYMHTKDTKGIIHRYGVVTACEELFMLGSDGWCTLSSPHVKASSSVIVLDCAGLVCPRRLLPFIHLQENGCAKVSSSSLLVCV